MIEAARQLLKHRPETRLLLTAPSNAAADLLCTRIADGIDPSCILRLNARRREPASVPQEILAFSHRDEEGRGFDYPELDKLKKFRVVVATCSTADLRAIGVEPGHFSHIFIDEVSLSSFFCSSFLLYNNTDLLPSLCRRVKLWSRKVLHLVSSFAFARIDFVPFCAAFLPITLANDSTSVILAGDPKQLGPVRLPSTAARCP